MSALRSELEQCLESARAFTRAIAAGVAEEALHRQFDPDFSPIAWHLGHIAWQEELWIARRLASDGPVDAELDAVFDSFSSVKAERSRRVPPRQRLDAYAARVRERTLELLHTLELRGDDALLRGGAVFRFIANHERQHAEIIGVVRLLGGLHLEPTPEKRASPAAQTAPPRLTEPEFVRVPGGSFPLGAGDDPDAWDNERPPRQVRVADFELQTRPVTCGQWLDFMAQGGYEDDRLWSAAGRRWRDSHRVRAPLFWRRDGAGGFLTRNLAGDAPLVPEAAVCHVSWFEAEAFARYAGARLPSEAEWEYAASWDHAAQRKRRYARWNARATRYAGPSDGAVWEWTDSVFEPYPGFEPQAYVGYSQPWFDGRHRVARGGSYLTQPEIARATFRNWYLPEVRQVPLGVRLART